MSEPQFIVLPIQGANGQALQSNGAVNGSGNDQLKEQMAQSQTVRRNNEATKQKEEEQKQAMEKKQANEHPSLVKQVTSDPSALYSFINWENPGRTAASFITVISLIISTRYFSPIQWILKIFCIVLGATSLMEVVGRVATKDSIMARVRPQRYYRPSERTSSRFFSELEEAADVTSVQLQKIIYAENLQGTGIAFALSFVTYWLVKAIPHFWLAIIFTILTYTAAPILTRQSSDPNAPNMKPEIDRKMQKLTNSALNNASSTTNHVTNTAQDLKSKAINTASSATDRATEMANDMKNRDAPTILPRSNNPFAQNQTSAIHQQDNFNRTMRTDADTSDYGHGLKTHSMDTAYSTNNPINNLDRGADLQYTGNNGSAVNSSTGYNQSHQLDDCYL